MSRQNFRLSDGRNLEYLSNIQLINSKSSTSLESDSPNQSSAVILHAGTTQDITGWQTWLEYFASRNVFALAIGRSGYVGSTKKSGRITIDIANDVGELATELGIKTFVNVGLSGGGQHAIATGLDSRSVGVVTIGSLAPFEEMGENFYTGMQQVDIDEYADALKDINLLIERFQRSYNNANSGAGTAHEVSDNDRLAMSKPTWKCLINSCNFTMSQGWDWVADDYSSYLKPWGFDPRSINVPAVIWQGGVDKNVPIQHGQWLAANIPNARLELRPEESHLGIFVNYEIEIMESAITLLSKK
jgi:pimeloyl-ACP methyl ester carboxylesterase